MESGLPKRLRVGLRPFPVKRLGDERSILLELKVFATPEKSPVLLKSPTPLPLNKLAKSGFFAYSGLDVSSFFLTLTILNKASLTFCWQWLTHLRTSGWGRCYCRWVRVSFHRLCMKQVAWRTS